MSGTLTSVGQQLLADHGRTTGTPVDPQAWTEYTDELSATDNYSDHLDSQGGTLDDFTTVIRATDGTVVVKDF